MWSFPTDRCSTTGSSTSSPSPSEQDPVPTAVIACGAIAASVRQVAARRGWDLEIHSLPSLLHNHPHDIAPRVEHLARQAKPRGVSVVVAYADCGTYGELDGVCERLGVRRLGGLHCYDVFAGPEKIREVFAEEAGTYVLTDFLVRSFRRSVLNELGLDRHPELWGDYFGQYRRVVWLAQVRTKGARGGGSGRGRTLRAPAHRPAGRRHRPGVRARVPARGRS